MASKEEMYEDCMYIYKEYKLYFEMLKVKEDNWIRWFSQFKTYRDLKKARDFLYKLDGYLNKVDRVYKLLAPHVWETLPQISNVHPAVVQMRQAVKELRNAWKQRPRRKVSMR